MHTTEFQKRGLPHVHLLLFLHPDNQYPSSDEIDQIISVEIPSHEDDPELYIMVQNHMVHGPCGILQSHSPCMKEGKCSRFYPKIFLPNTLLDLNGYLVYRRRNDGRTILKNSVIVDNRYLVPYNAKLLRKYQFTKSQYFCIQVSSFLYGPFSKLFKLNYSFVLDFPFLSSSKFVQYMLLNLYMAHFSNY